MAANPIRILHMIASNFVGGPEKQILHHAMDVRDAGIKVYIGSFLDQQERSEILKVAEECGLPTFETHSSGKFDPRAVWEVASFLKRERIQLLCTHGFKANTIGTLAKRFARLPQIAFCRGWTAETLRVRTYEFLERRMLAYADQIVCVSEAQAKIVGGDSRMQRRIHVVHNAVLQVVSPSTGAVRARLKTKLGIPQHIRLVGAVGRLSMEKGQRYLVEAAAHLVREFSDLRIVLLGDGRERANLTAQIEQLGLQDIIQLPGFQKNIAVWMGALDVLANCSLTEGVPNVILEALAVGTPVVATAVGGVPELIKDRETGLLVPPGDSSALAHGVAAILRDSQLASALSQAGRTWVESRFSPARQRDSLLGIYGHCLGLPNFPPVPESATTAQDSPATYASCPSPQAGAESNDRESLPFISVIIPARNEEGHIGAVLQDLLAQEYPADRYEVLVADGNSTDGTSCKVEEHAKVSRTTIRLLQNPNQLSSAGRNVGVRNSLGDLIVFIDAHCRIPSHRLLLDTANLFRTTGADCLCRPQPLNGPGNDWFQTVVADVRASAIGHGLDSTIFSTSLEGYVDPCSSGASYRRAVFERIGLYNERLDACEDVEFNYRVLRAGLRSYISPRLTVQYWPRNTLSGLWKQMVRYGKGRCRFTQTHPEAFSIAQTIPACFVLWLVLGGFAALTSKFLATIFLASLVVYGGVVIASSVWLGIRNGWRHMITAPAVCVTIHVGLGYGFLSEAFHLLRPGYSPWRSKSVEEAPLEVTHGMCSSSAAVPREHPHTGTYSVQDNGSLDRPLQQDSNGYSSRNSGPVNAFTVDVEDYYHTEAMGSVVSREKWDDMPSRVQSNTSRLFELLTKYDVRGTFFFLGWVAERYPGLVREALQLGHEVGCHSFWHRLVYRLSPQEFRSDTLGAKQAIEDAGGVRVRGYRAPSFSMVSGTSWAIDILAELGFDYDSSVHPIRHDLYSNASAPRVPHRIGDGRILELPIATARLGHTNLPLGGGGYLRILPYSYTRWGLSRFNRIETHPAVVYLHPWEIDPGQPRFKAPSKFRLRQYTGLATTERKLTSLLQDFRFAPISTVFQEELSNAASVKALNEMSGTSASFTSPQPEHTLDSVHPAGGS